MPQPSTLPRWAETSSGTQAPNVVGPPAGKQDTGYATGGDIPTSGGLNWLFRWIYKWCQYVAGLTGEALTWTARQTFSGGATVVDPPVNATDAASMGYVDAEATARAEAVTAEVSARTAADTAEATTRAAAVTAEATARANADALLMPKAGGTFTGSVAAPSLNAPAGGALAIGATDDHATTLNRNGIVGLSLDSDAQGVDLLGLALGASTHIRGVRTPLFDDWAANKGYVDTSVAGLTFPPSLQAMNPSNTGEFLGTVTFWKDVCGIVHLEGWVSHIAGSSVNVLQLPTGFRPASEARFSVNAGNVTVMTNGWVSVSELGILSWFLTPVAFRAA